MLGNINNNVINYNFKFNLLKVLKNFWFSKNYFSGLLILEVYYFYNKNYIKKSVEFIFNIKVIKINTLIKKKYLIKSNFVKNIKSKKVYIKFY